MTTPFELIEHVPVPAYVFGVTADDFVLEAVNAAGRAQNAGIVAFLGKPMAGLYRDQPQAIEDAGRCVTERTTVVREMAVRRYDRTEATQHVRLTYVFSAPDHMVLFMQSVATPATAEKALRESEARYRSLVSSLPDAVLLRGDGGRILACNDVAVRLFGANDQAALLGKHTVLAPGYSVKTERGDPVALHEFPGLRTLSTGQGEAGRLYALSAGADVRWVRVAAEPILSSSGAVSGSVTIFTDVTDLVLAQRASRESALRLDLALAAGRMGVWEYEPGADEGWWSKNLDSIFSFEPMENSLSAFLARVHPEDREEVLSAANQLSRGADGETFENQFRIVGDDGVTRWARTRGRISTETGRLYLGGTITDITEHRRLEEELRRAHRLESIGRLAGGVAHDFNNLLAAMLGSLELLEGTCPDEAKEDLATLRHGALRARDLTRQLLAFARKQPVEFKVTDLARLVRTVERMLRRLVGPRIDVVFSDDGATPVRADPSLLEQVLVNLVVNARDAMPSGGRLDVRVGRTGSKEPAGRAVLEVSDSGVGMDDETRRRVFDPFFTTKSHGTGLGLASSYGIVQQHGGDITVESQPGLGTCFRVFFPLEVDAARSEHPPPPPPPSGKGWILVVDDEDLVRNVTVRLLQSLGYNVLSAANAAEAVQRSRAHAGPIHLLLCDIAMPGKDGPAVALELKGERADLKILFASGYAEGTDCTSLAGSTFLQKPYGRNELAAKLEELDVGHG